ncbi:MAG: HIT domain-containing protein, partial [Candidatus Falkowbacteria bacterium]|nr:HIT domain-containing protein [Candidatus Falkowbacteria bacterium]
MPNGCIFCNGETQGIVLMPNETANVLLVLKPKKFGHIIIAPKTHITSLHEMGARHLNDMADLERQVEEIYNANLKPERLVTLFDHKKVAGNFEHVHCHIIPNPDDNLDLKELFGETEISGKDVIKLQLLFEQQRIKNAKELSGKEKKDPA